MHYQTGANLQAILAAYSYNGDGLRTSKTIAGMSVPFTWATATDLPTMLFDGTTAFIYGNGVVPLEQITGTTTIYYHRDQQNSTRALTDGAGNLLSSLTTDPYGNTLSSTGLTSTRLRYNGQFVDPETGFSYLRARYYHPQSHNFLTRDPVAADTRSVYSYASGNPLGAADPSGLCSVAGTLNPWSDDNCIREWSYDHPDQVDATARVASSMIKATPPGQMLQLGSQVTGHSLGGCVSGNVFGAAEVEGSVCYMSTPDGRAGFTLSGGGGGGAPWGGSGLFAPSISNAQTECDFQGAFQNIWGSGGEGIESGGGSVSFGRNQRGRVIWQATGGWAPGARVPAPAAGGAGVTYTVTLGWG